jgi:hypothetical protein
MSNGEGQTQNQPDGLQERKVAWIVVYSIIFAVAFVILPIVTYFRATDPIIKILVYVACSGGIGGLLYSIMGFTYHFEQADFDVDKYFWWYIYRPITASLLGVFLFFLVAGGLMALSGDTATIPDLTSGYTAKTAMFYCALSFLAGWSTNKVIGKLDSLTTVIFQKTP